MTSQPVQNPSDTPAAPLERRELSVRRAPKFVPFMIAGGLVGVLVAAIFTYMAPGGEEFDRGSVFGFLTVLLILPGIGLGAAVALVLDRRSRRRATTAVVESVSDDVPVTDDEL